MKLFSHYLSDFCDCKMPHALLDWGVGVKEGKREKREECEKRELGVWVHEGRKGRRRRGANRGN